jgi:chromosome segregation ATPase
MTEDRIRRLEGRLHEQEARLGEQETVIRGLLYENECVKKQVNHLLSRHETLAQDHVLLAKSYFDAKKRIVEFLNDHNNAIKQLAVLAGNSAKTLFPKLSAAFEEIDEKLGLKPKSD